MDKAQKENEIKWRERERHKHIQVNEVVGAL